MRKLLLLFAVLLSCSCAWANVARTRGGDVWVHQISGDTFALRGWLLLTQAPGIQDSARIDWGDSQIEWICLADYSYSMNSQGALVQYERTHNFNLGTYNIIVVSGKRVPFIRNIPNSETTNFMNVAFIDYDTTSTPLELPLADSVNFEVEMNLNATNVIPQTAVDFNGDSIRFYRLSAPAPGFVQPEVAGGGTFNYSSGNGYYSWNPDTAGLYVVYFGVYEYRLSPSLNWVSYGVHTREVLIDVGAVSALPQYPTAPNSFSMYPNPANGAFTVECGEGSSVIIIRDTEGRTIKISSSSNAIATIDLSGESDGVYFCTVQREDGTAQTCRFVKTGN